MAMLSEPSSRRFLATFLDKLRGELRSLPLFDCKSTRRADTYAETGSVAQFLAHDSCLPVNELNGPFRAWSHALAAAVTKFLVNPDNLSLHHYSLPR